MSVVPSPAISKLDIVFVPQYFLMKDHQTYLTYTSSSGFFCLQTFVSFLVKTHRAVGAFSRWSEGRYVDVLLKFHRNCVRVSVVKYAVKRRYICNITNSETVRTQALLTEQFRTEIASCTVLSIFCPVN